MLGNPARTQPGDGLVQSILTKPILLSQRGEGGLPFPRLRAFFFNDTPPTKIYTLSLHDALPIRHPEIELIPVLEDEMLLVVAARHPFAARGKVRMDELAAERLILFDRTSSYHELTSSLFRQAGVVPASTLELDNVEAAKKMVQQGLGVALLPRMALAAELRSRSLRPVR